MNKLLNHVLAASCFAILAGCGNGDDAPKADAPIAEVNGRAVPQAAFEAYLQVKRIGADDKQRRDRELDNYLQRTGLTEVILSEGLLPAERVDAEVEEFRKQMVISRYFENYLKDKVSEQAIRNFYAANPDRYQAKKVHVAHVLIRTNNKMGDNEKQALLNKAQEVYSRAMAQEDFATLAATYSDDAMSARKGGDLGWIQQGAIDAAFSKAAFDLKEGEVSQPIATPFGFHVVKVLEAAQVIKQPYEKVKGDIRFELRQKAKEAEMARLNGLVKIVRQDTTADKKD